MKIGERAGVILSSNEKEIELFGYGVYIGDEVPPKNATGFGKFLNEAEITNPCILLDDGKKVFGCESWWGPQEKVEKMIGGRAIIKVDIDTYRMEATK